MRLLSVAASSYQALWLCSAERNHYAPPGIIPGFGGTARLPRLVGLEKALTMMLRSKNIQARARRAVGWLTRSFHVMRLTRACRHRLTRRSSRG